MQKRSVLSILFCLIFTVRTPTASALDSSTAYAGAFTAAIGAYVCYHYLNTPYTPKPTIESIHPVSGLPISSEEVEDENNPFLVKSSQKYYHLEPGIAACSTDETTPLWILASGWKTIFDQVSSKRAEASYVGLRRYLKRNIFHGPSITFDYSDNRRSFNFGQDLDQQAFDTLYQASNNRPVIAYGLCRGALTIIGWLESCENRNNVKAVILESPATSLADICSGLGKQTIHLGQGNILHTLFKQYFPNYNSHTTSVVESLHKLHLEPNTPIFIGHIKGDSITTDEQVAKLVKTLRATCSNPVYFFVCKEPLGHGKLSRSLAYQQVINAFLKKYGLPHNAALAEQGEELLKEAQR